MSTSTDTNLLSPIDPALGGGKAKSVIYQTKLCLTDKEIDEYINKDAYAYSYIYWNPQAKGVFVTLCKPNPEAHKRLYAKRVEQGLIIQTVDEAKQAALEDYKKLSYIDGKLKKHQQFTDEEISKFTSIFGNVLSTLYERGYRLFAPQDKERQP